MLKSFATNDFSNTLLTEFLEEDTQTWLKLQLSQNLLLSLPPSNLIFCSQSNSQAFSCCVSYHRIDTLSLFAHVELFARKPFDTENRIIRLKLFFFCIAIVSSFFTCFTFTFLKTCRFSCFCVYILLIGFLSKPSKPSHLYRGLQPRMKGTVFRMGQIRATIFQLDMPRMDEHYLDWRFKCGKKNRFTGFQRSKKHVCRWRL